MKLLIITQKVSMTDPVLGFFHRWILEFAKHSQQVIVICLEEGDYNLPNNVKVLSLGKEKGYFRFRYLFNFFRYLWQERKNYDKVFVHMNPIYIVLAGWWWKFIGRQKVFLWYTHKTVDWKLKIAEKFSTQIFTASQESFRLPSEKIIVTGHGIDTNFFQPNVDLRSSDNFYILTVGRLSKTKGHDLIIKAVRVLYLKKIPVKLLVIGGAGTKHDEKYANKLKRETQSNGDFVSFLGALTQTEIVKYFQKTDVFVNASQTESLDKTILESMACESLLVSSNDSAKAILGKFDKNLIFEKNNVDDLVRSLEYCYQNSQKLSGLRKSLRQEVIDHHNLSKLINDLISIIK